MSDEKKKSPTINAELVGVDITMLKTWLDEGDIKPLLSALEGLKEKPESEAALQKVVNAFNELGIMQGAVLTYATYIKTQLPKLIDFFDNDW